MPRGGAVRARACREGGREPIACPGAPAVQCHRPAPPPRSNRITSIDTALERKQEADRSSALTIVAVDVPLRAGGGAWLEQMVAVFAPVGVWAVVEATRKPEDVGPWLDALPRVDALMVQDTDLTADPAAVLGRTSTPVALLDGARATAHRWASLLCERLETAGS